ncbi:MAG: hypothetical protein AAFN07_15985, partial [Pseudomonadota bacterium]
MFRILRISALVFAASLVNSAANATPLLTGVIEDVAAQTIEMPSLPGGWQRRIEWMAAEGTEVSAGEMVVRLDPGTLIGEEEKTRADLEKIRFTAARRVDEARLAVLDAEQALSLAQAQTRIAELDAVIPEQTIPRLDFERYQLTFETAQQTQRRARQSLINLKAKLADAEKEAAL